MENGSQRVIIELKGVEKTYFLEGDNQVHALRGVDLSIRQGSFVAIMGPSGSGKTTLGKTLLRLAPLTAGQIIYAGQDISRVNAADLHHLRARIQMIFQDPYASLSPRL